MCEREIMRKWMLIPLVLVLAAIATAFVLIWSSQNSVDTDIEQVREVLKSACADEAKRHPSLLGNPTAFYHREGTNGFKSCAELKAKLYDLSDQSSEDERGDWWDLFTLGPDLLVPADEVTRAKLYEIAVDESAVLDPLLKQLDESDFILVTPDERFNFDVGPVLFTATFLRDRVRANCLLKRIEPAKADAALLCRLVHKLDCESTQVVSSIYPAVCGAAFEVLALVSDQTRDPTWYAAHSKLAKPAIDFAVVLRNERVAVYARISRTAERTREELEQSVESSLGYEFTDPAHVLECARTLLVDYFALVGDFAINEFDLSQPETSRRVLAYVDELGDPETSYSAYTLGLILDRMEADALRVKLLDVFHELRRLELEGVKLNADAPEVNELLKVHTAVRLVWSEDKLEARITPDHPRHSREPDDVPAMEYRFLSSR